MLYELNGTIAVDMTSSDGKDETKAQGRKGKARGEGLRWAWVDSCLKSNLRTT